MKDMIQEINEGFLTFSHGEIYKNIMDYLEKMVIEKALHESGGNQLMAAKILGLNRNTLHTKLRKYNINVQRFKI